MNDMFPVQKGVPIPEINRAPKSGRRKYPIESMGVGDMFFIEERPTKLVSAYISRISKDLPGKFSARHCWMRKVGSGWETAEPGTKGAKEGTGVWRIE